MKKILYISYVDWDWIKQRPHFIAEQLSYIYDVSVLYQRSRKRDNLQHNVRNGMNIHSLCPIPGATRFHLIEVVNNVFMHMLIVHYLCKYKPNIVVLTYPTQIAWVPKWYKGKIVYDCMDHHASIFGGKKRAHILRAEQRLCNHADLVLVSSERLNGILRERYGCKNIITVRNGYNGEIADTTELRPHTGERYVFCYFGTISSWFNFDYLIKSLEDFPQIEYWLMGPVEKGVTVPRHERVKYLGVIEHHDLFAATRLVDCFVMPFIINDLILSVDPVKLYEYINFDRHILCVQYDEIQRFEKYVWFYTDYISYKEQVAKIVSGEKKKYNEKERIEMLLNSSWKSRVQQIAESLEKL